MALDIDSFARKTALAFEGRNWHSLSEKERAVVKDLERAMTPARVPA